jgi:hypothetical protein
MWNLPDAFILGTFSVGAVVGSGLTDGVGLSGPVPLGVADGDAVVGPGSGVTELVGRPATVTGVSREFTQTERAITTTTPTAIPAHSRGPMRTTAAALPEATRRRAAQRSSGLLGWLTGRQ